jgi:tricorn protease-like protein
VVDERLRRSERAWREQGDVASEARHLRERLRVGDLTAEKLELAARVGHEAAKVALGQDPAVFDGTWFAELPTWGFETAARGALAAARAILTSGGVSELVMNVLDQVEAHLHAPKDENRESIQQGYRRAVEESPAQHHPNWIFGQVIELVLEPAALEANFEEFARLADRYNPHFVKKAVAAEVAPWALGLFDPMKSRAVREGRSFASEPDIVRSVSFSPDGTRILSSNCTGDVTIRPVEGGASPLALPRKSREVFIALFTPDGARVVSGDLSGNVRVHDATTGAELRSFAVSPEGVTNLAVLPDGKRAFVGGYDRKARLLDLETGLVLRLFEGHERTIGAVAVSRDGSLAATGGGEGSLGIWDVATGERLAYLPAAHESTVEDLAFSPDGERIVTAGYDKVLKVWESRTGRLVRTLAGHTSQVSAVAISLDGRRIASAGAEVTVALWDLATGERLHVWDRHPSLIICLGFSPDGRTLVTGGRAGGLRLFDVPEPGGAERVARAPDTRLD